MIDKNQPATRRDMLKKTAGMAGVAAVAAVVMSQKAHAEGSMSQASVQYQDSPKDGHQCDGCALYVPGPSATANGQCTAVAGVISPKGWCSIWSAKS